MKLKLILFLVLAVLSLTIKIMWGTIEDLKYENERKSSNIESLFQAQDSLKYLANGQAVEVRALRLTKNEFKEYRDESEKKLKDMGVQIRHLKAAGKHNMQIKIPISGKLDIDQQPEPSEDDEHPVRQDSAKVCPDYKANIYLENPYLLVTGKIINDSIDIKAHTSVELDQGIEVIPKHKFLFWQWGVKGIKQTIGTDNPYVTIKYSEFILVD